MEAKNPRSLPNNPRREGVSADAISEPDALCAGASGSGELVTTACTGRDASGKDPSSKLPREKFDPAVDQYLSAKRPRSATAAAESLPLLCQEACNLLVAACRDAVKREGAAPLAP